MSEHPPGLPLKPVIPPEWRGEGDMEEQTRSRDILGLLFNRRALEMSERVGIESDPDNGIDSEEQLLNRPLDTWRILRTNMLAGRAPREWRPNTTQKGRGSALFAHPLVGYSNTDTPDSQTPTQPSTA